MKAISAIIVIILVVMIVVTLAALSYGFFSGIFTTTTKTTEESVNKTTTGMLANMKIESASENIVYVRNIGQSDLTKSDFAVYVNDNPVDFNVTPPTVKPGDIGEISVTDYVGERNVEISVMTMQGAKSTKKFNNMIFCDDPDVVLCLTFDEGSGTIAYDHSLYGNDGTLHNGTEICSNGYCPKWVSGKSGGALEFDGVGDFVNITSTPSLNVKGKFTIEILFKIYSIAKVDEFNDIINTQDGDVETYEIYIYDGNNIVADFYNSTGTRFTIDEYNLVTIGEWYYIVFTYDKDGGTDNLKLYVNGVLENSTTGFGELRSTTNPFHIGIYKSGASSPSFYHGIIDEIRILNKTLPVSKIAEIYNNYNL